ncbi:MAG: PorV/PorQ family protein [Candidatus Zixiibacteriota bacterium]|nr:MAG: PorV/PorQ family protein [candidate division Zixibacteria bacterium]
MMRIRIFVLCIMLMAAGAYSAKYAGEPFSLGVGARALAMGGATIAGPSDGAAGYWNPAGLNHLTGHNLIAMHAETFGSLLNHDFVGYSRRRSDDRYIIRSYGLYFYYLGGGGIKITDIDPVSRRFYVVREESHGDFMLGASAAGRFNDRIDVGVTVRVIYRDMPTIRGYGLTADAGALYDVHQNVRFGLAITDLFSGFIRYSGGNTESVLPTVKPGLLLFHTISDFTGRLAASGDIKFEGIRSAAQFWTGEVSLDSHFGLEVSFREMIFGRAGFDIGNFTGGVGVDINRIKVDLAYLHNDYLDETFRVSAGYSF